MPGTLILSNNNFLLILNIRTCRFFIFYPAITTLFNFIGPDSYRGTLLQYLFIQLLSYHIKTFKKSSLKTNFYFFNFAISIFMGCRVLVNGFSTRPRDSKVVAPSKGSSPSSPYTTGAGPPSPSYSK